MQTTSSTEMSKYTSQFTYEVLCKRASEKEPISARPHHKSEFQACQEFIDQFVSFYRSQKVLFFSLLPPLFFNFLAVANWRGRWWLLIENVSGINDFEKKLATISLLFLPDKSWILISKKIYHELNRFKNIITWNSVPSCALFNKSQLKKISGPICQQKPEVILHALHHFFGGSDPLFRPKNAPTPLKKLMRIIGQPNPTRQ